MLGARARAAEYNAFKAASARQASREAEEQKLPPKPAPVSLSAFTKNTQISRNKGTKAYVPFVLEDTSDDNDEILDNPHDTDQEVTSQTNETNETNEIEANENAPSTPTRQIHILERGDAASPALDTPLGPRNPQPVRTTQPAFSAPTAPRAMLPTADRGPRQAIPTPQRPAPQPIARGQPQQAVPLSVQSSPNTFSGIVYPPVASYFPPPQYQGNMMGPSDLSPTKQENKLAMLSQDPGDPSRGFGANRQQGMSNRSPNMDNTYATATPSWSRYEGFGSTFTNNPSQRPLFQNFENFENFDPDRFVSPNEEKYRRLPIPSPNLPRGFSYPETEGLVLTPGGTLDSPEEITARQAQHESAGTPEGEDEPYDRNSKMQNFVAAQQALAKTGKTVLHNPDLHRAKAFETPASDNSTPIPEYGSRLEGKGNINDAGNGSWLRPPPGFETRKPAILNLDEPVASNPSPFNDEALRKEFGVGTDDWFELKPVSREERLKMNKVMRLSSTAMNVDAPKALTKTGRRTKLGSKQDDLDGTRTVKNMVDQIADDHVASRLANLDINKADSNASADIKVEGASIRAVGDIWTNITAAESEQEAIPNKYKPAPEYAVERGRLLTGGSGSSSFFEEDTGGFYNAPSRIARDPRFRPTNIKDGSKSKPDDEWKNRVGMYGRRRL